MLGTVRSTSAEVLRDCFGGHAPRRPEDACELFEFAPPETPAWLADGPICRCALGASAGTGFLLGVRDFSEKQVQLYVVGSGRIGSFQSCSSRK